MRDLNLFIIVALLLFTGCYSKQADKKDHLGEVVKDIDIIEQRGEYTDYTNETSAYVKSKSVPRFYAKILDDIGYKGIKFLVTREMKISSDEKEIVKTHFHQAIDRAIERYGQDIVKYNPPFFGEADIKITAKKLIVNNGLSIRGSIEGELVLVTGKLEVSARAYNVSVEINADMRELDTENRISMAGIKNFDIHLWFIKTTGKISGEKSLSKLFKGTKGKFVDQLKEMLKLKLKVDGEISYTGWDIYERVASSKISSLKGENILVEKILTNYVTKWVNRYTKEAQRK